MDIFVGGGLFFFWLRTYEILSSHKYVVGKGIRKTFQIIVAILFAVKLYFVVFVVVILSLLLYVTSQMQFLLPSSPQSPRPNLCPPPRSSPLPKIDPTKTSSQTRTGLVWEQGHRPNTAQKATIRPGTCHQIKAG